MRARGGRGVASTVGAGQEASSQLVRQRDEGEGAGEGADDGATRLWGRAMRAEAGGGYLFGCGAGSRDGRRRGLRCGWARRQSRGHRIRTT
jgi:hypothetical protein